MREDGRESGPVQSVKNCESETSVNHIVTGGLKLLHSLAMARKTSARSESAHGFNDIVGIVLIGFALLLLVALLSYDLHDVPANGLPTNPSPRNWIGPFGAWLAYYWFLWVGGAAYELPGLLIFLGLGCFFHVFAYLRRRWIWTVVLFLCCIGLLDLYHPYLGKLENNIHSMAGGVVGVNLNRFFFGYFGVAGATIIFLMLFLISLLFLTNFQLGEWLRGIVAKRAAATNGAAADEHALERRARELQKEKKKLEEEVARTGLGADLQPVPEPTVRDLSLPAAKPGRGKKEVQTPEPSSEPLPADEGEVIPAREVAAAVTSDILGKKSELSRKGSEGKTEASTAEKGAADSKPAETPPEPEIRIDGVPTARGKMKAAKRKPITVASTPLIGNYQLPSLDFLQHPDPTLKPTESKEELMANARLMQQTLEQFDIEVSLGDITKGPTITRYELHPAPGVKLEKNHGVEQQHCRGAKGRTHSYPRACPGQKFRWCGGAERREDEGHYA